jgi:hypothetical protein
MFSPESLIVFERVFVLHSGQLEGFTGLSVVIADVPSKRHQGPNERGEAQNEDHKQYAHGNQHQG